MDIFVSEHIYIMIFLIHFIMNKDIAFEIEKRKRNPSS